MDLILFNVGLSPCYVMSKVNREQGIFIRDGPDI